MDSLFSEVFDAPDSLFARIFGSSISRRQRSKTIRVKLTEEHLGHLTRGATLKFKAHSENDVEIEISQQSIGV